MKKIEFWVTHKVKNKEKYFNEHSSVLTRYDYDEKKYMFLSNFSSFYEIYEVNMEYLNFKSNIDWKAFLDLLLEVYCESMKEARNITNEPIGTIVKGNHPSGSFYSVIYKYIHSEKEKNIFQFCGDLFISLLSKHTLWNGNKRTSIVFIKTLLELFGYYFRWTGGFYKDYQKHEEKVVNFIKCLKNPNQKNVEKCKKNIYNWVEKNSFISIGVWL